jgi:hypothetical protein
MMKKLKPRNRRLNGVVPAEASRPWSLTGWKAKPTDPGTSRRRSRSASPSAVVLPSGATRKAVTRPKRLPQSRCPVAKETNALGVRPCCWK